MRGDIALPSPCLETGNFGFSGSAVRLEQNNFCRMGVTENGMKGNSLIRPIWQHPGAGAASESLWQYGKVEEWEGGPGFSMWQRLCAFCGVAGDSGQSAGKGGRRGRYGEKILSILKSIIGGGRKQWRK